MKRWAQKERQPGYRMEQYRPVIVYSGKTDVQSAFRVVPLSIASWNWLIFKAENPKTGLIQYFVDKCLPFGASISCSHFQRISDGLKHITQVKTGEPITNYLDDFLFLAITMWRCNQILQQFLQICEQIGFPIAMEKMEWATEVLTFLGIFLDGRHYVLSIPLEKRDKAISLLNKMLRKNKTTIWDLQALCGYLNFLGKAIYLGRVFTRRMYAKYANLVQTKLAGYGTDHDDMTVVKFHPKPFHHIKLDTEFKRDCQVWLTFLQDTNLRDTVN